MGLQLTTTECVFNEAWRGQCGEPAVGDGNFCQKHAGLKCASCGNPAIRSCDHTGIQFVCGSPLCGNCSHGAPPRDNPGIFMLGGGHVPTEVASQQWEAYYR